MPTPVVLVVDDEALIRWSLSESLGESGFVVQSASTAAEARRALSLLRDQPMVVVLDLRLPDMKDLSLVHEIRADRPDAPLIVMTSHYALDEAEQSELASVSRLIGKPFDVTMMGRLVTDAWMNATRPSDSPWEAVAAATLPLYCAHCRGAVAAQLCEPPTGAQRAHQTFSCPYCREPNTLTLPGVLAWVCKRPEPTGKH